MEMEELRSWHSCGENSQLFVEAGRTARVVKERGCPREWLLGLTALLVELLIELLVEQLCW
jgi:hypothetical protein